MSHEVESMAYTGNPPWHGLGVSVDSTAKPREIQQAAGLDWEVLKVPLWYSRAGKDHESGHYALIRSSDGQFLDTVKSERWTPVQNSVAFEFFNHFVRAGDMTMEVAGSLSDGKRVFALAKLKHCFRLAAAAEDATQGYLLFTNPHLYGHSVDIRFTPVRVVCMNTLSLALGQKNNDYRISFNHSRGFVEEEARKLVAVAADKLADYKQQADGLASKRYKPDTLRRYFQDVFAPKVPPRTEEPPRSVVLAHEVVETQPGHKHAPGSWWNAFNAVTYLTDHKIGRRDATRLGTAWYGQGKMRKKKALDLAVEYAKAA